MQIVTNMSTTPIPAGWPHESVPWLSSLRVTLLALTIWRLQGNGAGISRDHSAYSHSSVYHFISITVKGSHPALTILLSLYQSALSILIFHKQPTLSLVKSINS